jgi:N-acetylglutamate synthase-like GNAT family acetyltransferase
MANAAERPVMTPDRFGEKEFYLDEFRAHTLCFAVPIADCERAGGFESLAAIIRDLIGNDTRVIILLGVDLTEQSVAAWTTRVRRRLQPLVVSEQTASSFPTVRGRRSLSPLFLDLTHGTDLDTERALRLEMFWQILRAGPLIVGLVEHQRLVDVAQRLTTRLRVLKLVIVEAAGGVATPQGGALSFMDDAMLTAVLQTGEAEWAGLQGRRQTLQAIQVALRGGVRAVNLCTLDGLAHELFTYEGSGTLFTLADYCHVERLGIDDFEEVERLLQRGQREGYLKDRSPDEIARILLEGYGAQIDSGHLAGVCGLETDAYQAQRAGEIVGLYTITRFKGEGVGVRLVDRVMQDAQEAGLRYVFAVTIDSRAQVFFERRGFRLVAPEHVPPAKWIGYDENRRQQVKVLRYDLVVGGGSD